VNNRGDREDIKFCRKENDSIGIVLVAWGMVRLTEFEGCVCVVGALVEPRKATANFLV
jgi:hypothetical protein